MALRVGQEDGRRQSAAILLKQVSKRYGRIQALDGVSLAASFGQCVALVGPNGAGKTTTLRILSSLIHKFSGIALLDGHDVRDSPPPVGALIEGPALYPYLSTEDNLRYLAAVAGLPSGRVTLVMEVMRLTEVSKRKAGSLSHGMRQRLGLASALLADPQFLLLDEPMTGLDPSAQHHMRDVIRNQAESGKAVLISTHNLAEVEALAHELVFLKEGRVVACGPIGHFQQGVEVRIELRDPEAARTALEASGYRVSAVGASHVAVDSAGKEAEHMVRVLADSGLYPASVEVRRSSLEEVYLRLMGEAAGDS